MSATSVAVIPPPGPFLVHCQEVCKAASSNFTSAFALLPLRQRQAMMALYAFMRQTDDISDEPGDPQEKQARLDGWESQLNEAVQGKSGNPILEGVSWLIRCFGLPLEYFQEVIQGVREDLSFGGFANRREQDDYCYKVASVVGLCCIRIWGATDPAAEAPSIATGLAFQRTNILRDIKEDLERGRCYIPRDVLTRFGVEARVPENPAQVRAWTELIRFEIEQCQLLYQAGRKLFPFLPKPGRAVLFGFSGVYHGLLKAIGSNPESIWKGRVRLGPVQKGSIFLRALIMRYLGC